MTNKEFFEQCQVFDWYYDFSDDGGVYRAGFKRRNELIDIAGTDPVKHKIFMDWQNFMFSGKPWGTVQPPQPKVEDYV